MNEENKTIEFKGHCLVVQVGQIRVMKESNGVGQLVERRWEIVSQSGPQDNEDKEVRLCYLEDRNTWRLLSDCVADEVLVARIDQDTRASKHGRGLHRVSTLTINLSTLTLFRFRTSSQLWVQIQGWFSSRHLFEIY